MSAETKPKTEQELIDLIHTQGVPFVDVMAEIAYSHDKYAINAFTELRLCKMLVCGELDRT